MNWIRQIDDKYGPSGWLMAVSASSFLLLLLMMVVSKDFYTEVLSFLAMPASVSAFAHKPWTLLTYWLAAPVMEIWTLIASLSVIYSFGTLTQTLIGYRRFTIFLLSSLFAIPVLLLILSSLLPTIENVGEATVFGLFPLSISLAAMTTWMAPNQQVRLFSFEFRLLWLGIAVMALPLIGYKAIFSTMGTATSAAILVGLAAGIGMKKLGKPVRWKSALASSQLPKSVRERVVVKEKTANPQHKGKFTVVHSQPRLSKEEELNMLLDRINEVGYQGLTPKEKKRLEELSGDS